MIDDGLVRRLEEAWQPARDAGVLGPAPLRSLHGHACGFILNSWRELPSGSFVDCGAGAGVLGIFLALELPASCWVLVDSSERRCDLALRAVAAVGLEDRVRVEHSDLDDFAHRPRWRERQDGVVARLFGQPAELAECGLPLVRNGAALVVSVSAATRVHWEDLDLLPVTGCEAAEAWATRHGHYLAVRRMRPGPPELPRRRAARRRLPLGRLRPS